MALSIIPWKKAVKLLVTEKAESVETGNSVCINMSSGRFNISSIIRLVIDIPWRAHNSRMKFSRRRVLIRDNYKCVYCGKTLGNNNTIDHIIPRSKGGATTFGNCVACCKPCNNKKADKTLEQVGFKLNDRPKRPTFVTLYKHYLKEYSPSEWNNYIIGI